jgi:hypothetical protein
MIALVPILSRRTGPLKEHYATPPSPGKSEKVTSGSAISRKGRLHRAICKSEPTFPVYTRAIPLPEAMAKVAPNLLPAVMARNSGILPDPIRPSSDLPYQDCPSRTVGYPTKCIEARTRISRGEGRQSNASPPTRIGSNMLAAQSPKKPEHENNHQYQAENPAKPTMAIPVIAVVAAPASQQQDDQNDDQNCAQSFLPMASFSLGRSALLRNRGVRR